MTIEPSQYLDNSDRNDVLSGGVRMIPISTTQGEFRVWTKRVGNSPSTKVLLLHGGPGATHEYFEACDSFLPRAGVEYYYYDQLGSAYSDDPGDPSLLEIDRFVDEVEQVRIALDLGPDNFYLLGHSWGGLLAIEYALAHQRQLKGLIISNMMSSIPSYNRYADTVLKPEMDQGALAEIERLEASGETDDPRYFELLLAHHYVEHVLRIPFDEWPEPVMRSFKHTNGAVYVPMQGPSELGASGKLRDWDRTEELCEINVPTLVIGARHDTMDPAFLAAMAARMPRGTYLECPNGSHLAMYDDQEAYFAGLLTFLAGPHTEQPTADGRRAAPG